MLRVVLLGLCLALTTVKCNPLCQNWCQSNQQGAQYYLGGYNWGSPCCDPCDTNVQSYFQPGGGLQVIPGYQGVQPGYPRQFAPSFNAPVYPDQLHAGNYPVYPDQGVQGLPIQAWPGTPPQNYPGIPVQMLPGMPGPVFPGYPNFGTFPLPVQSGVGGGGNVVYPALPSGNLVMPGPSGTGAQPPREWKCPVDPSDRPCTIYRSQPSECNSHEQCISAPIVQKCCYDNCLSHKTCKPAVPVY